MSDISKLDQIVNEIRTASTECGALIIHAILSLEPNTVPVASVSGDDFPNLIKQIRPKLIYIEATPFDAGTEMLASLEMEDEEFVENSRSRKLISKWRYREGQTCRVVLGVMWDGVLHGVIETASWLADFESDVEAIGGELETSREQNQRKSEIEEKRQLAPKIKQLMDDPRFAAPKVGISKRTALAQTLFPDLDRSMIRLIVELAESEHWLATAGK